MIPDITLAELVAQVQGQYVGLIFGIDDVVFAYIAIALTVISTALQFALQPGPPKPPKASSLEDFEAPTAEEGRPIPVVFGEVLVRGPNVVWYGDFSHEPIEKEDIVVGYRYSLGMHMIICQGPVDAVKQIVVNDRQAWEGTITTSGTLGIDQEGLFGGDESEGGLGGIIEIMFGEPDQEPSPYLAQTRTLNTGVAFRGVFGFVLRGVTLSNGFYFGTTKYLKPWAIRLIRKPGRVWNGTDWDFWYEAKNVIDGQANPAHVVYEIWTNAEWGMGYPEAAIDDTRMRALADTLYAEGIGLGFIWTRQSQIDEFLSEVLNHISAVPRLDPATGKLWIKLLRDDYDVESLPVLDESNIVELESFQRVGWADTVNEIVVKYRGVSGREKMAPPAQNLANVQIQGRVVSETVDYPACRSKKLATQLANRDLKIKSCGLAAFRATVNRSAFALGPGDPFLFSWAALGLSGVVMRTGEVKGGTLLDRQIVITAAEDVFSLGDTVVADDDPETWVQPDPLPDPATFPPPTAPTDLAAASDFQLIIWTWTVTQTDAKTEVWVSQTDDRATAVRIYQDYGARHEQQAAPGSTWYGWVRARDKYRNYSDWSPLSATAGVAGAANSQIPANTIEPGGLTSVHPYSGDDVSVPYSADTLILDTLIALSQPAGTTVGLSVSMDFVGSTGTRLVALLIHDEWFTIYDRPQDISVRFVSAQRFKSLIVPADGFGVAEPVQIAIKVRHEVSPGPVLYEAPTISVMEIYA